MMDYGLVKQECSIVTIAILKHIEASQHALLAVYVNAFCFAVRTEK
jgi:hypothetical protein